MHTLFARTSEVAGWWVRLDLPDLRSVRPGAVGIVLLAGVLLFRLRWSVLRSLGACDAAGLLAGAVAHRWRAPVSP